MSAWPILLDAGFFAHCVKGNPYTSHARGPGDSAALCGARPGQSKGAWRMKDRTGWRYYPDGREPTCVKCHAIINEIFPEQA